MIGTIIDQYEILERIAAGGMGEIYRARDLELDRDVAIKSLRAELSDLDGVHKRFRNEARTLAALSHLNIATVYRFFEDQGRMYLVMEYIEGRPFGKLLANEGFLTPARAVSLVSEALHGLGYAHKNQVVHRDIKPGNLMLDHHGHVKILDFGIAHLVGSTRMTRVGSLVGTPAYMAPEQILGKEVDPRTDLYSIGIVLFEMLSGKLPYEADSDFEIMRAHVESVPRSLSDLCANNVPQRLQQTVERALEKDSKLRFQSAEEFAEILQNTVGSDETEILPGVAPVAAPTSALAATEPFSVDISQSDPEPSAPASAPRRKRFLALGACLAAVAMLAAGFAGLLSISEDQPGAPAGFAMAQPSITRSSTPATAVQPTASLTTGAVKLADSEQVADSSPGPGAAIGPAALSSAAEPNVKQAPPAQDSAPPAATTTLVKKPASARRSLPPPVASLAVPQAETLADSSMSHDYRIRTIKFGAHSNQRTGRASRAAAYNAAFALTVPNGAEPIIEVDELVRVYRSGELVREQLVKTEPRSAGQFKTKARVKGLKTLEPGIYDMQLLLRHDNRTLGQASWKLAVRG